MKVHYLTRFVAAALTLSMATGASCRNRRGDGGNGGTGGELTQTQQDAVNVVVGELQATAKALGGVANSFTGVDANGDVTAGQCPVVTAQFNNGTSDVVVDFGNPGCTSSYYDNKNVSGSVGITLDTIARSLDVIFNDLTVDSATTSGTANWTLVRTGSLRTLTGAVDLSTTGVGSAAGDLDLRVDAVGLTLQVVQGDLLITDSNGASYSVIAAGINIDPIANGNFIADNGTVTFEVPNESAGPDTVTLEIAFTADSPNTGIVLVTIGDAPAVEYRLPGH